MEQKYLQIIESMPDIFLDQFFKIACYYMGYTEGAKNKLNTSSDKIVYINEISRTQMMLNKLLMISTNGINVESQINKDSEKANKAILEAYEFLKKRSTLLVTAETVDDTEEVKFIANNDVGEPIPLDHLGLEVPNTDGLTEKKSRAKDNNGINLTEDGKVIKEQPKKSKTKDNVEVKVSSKGEVKVKLKEPKKKTTKTSKDDKDKKPSEKATKKKTSTKKQ